MNFAKKIISRKEIEKISQKLRQQGKKIVFTNGCFDILHPGHIKILSEAKKKGDILIVGINSDRSIKKIKGHLRPILPEKARANLIAALEMVNYVVIFNETTPYNLIKIIQPNILVKGGDWPKESIVGREFAKKVIRIPLVKNFSTSKIINIILKKYGSTFSKNN